MSISILSICIGLLVAVMPVYKSSTPPKISLKVSEEDSFEGRDIPLYITVDHNSSDTIDAKSFQLDGRPITVDFLQQQVAAPEGLYGGDTSDALAIDRYRTILPKMTPGVHAIGPVTVMVRNSRYSSGTISVHVQEAIISDDFRLETKIAAPPKIFMGQEVVFEYRVFFTRTMQLTKETLPLLNVDGFIPIGAPEISTEHSKNGLIQTIKQRAKASRSGQIEIPASLMEGMAVEGEGAYAQAVPPLYRAIVPKMSLAILPFPDRGRPEGFDGALGSFTWRTSVPSGTKVSVGDPVGIEYRVSGRGDLSTVQFPPFDRLNKLTEYFWTDVRPPTGEDIEGTRRFLLIVKPKKAGKIDIPGFVFSSFDPISEKYLVSMVPPISLQVTGSVDARPLGSQEPALQREGLVSSYELTEFSAHQEHIPGSIVLISLFIALLVGIFEAALSWEIKKKREEKKVTSRDLFYKAFMDRSNRELCLKTLKQAFYLRLFELKLSQSLVDTPEALEGAGIVADVRGFLQFIDKQLYKKGEGRAPLKDLQEEASTLYYKLKVL